MNGKTCRRANWVFGLLTIILMAVIFIFSAMPRDASASMSGRITEAAIRYVYPDYGSMTAAQREGALALLDHLIRKLAHLTEYALLGALLRLFFGTIPQMRRATLWAWLAATAYAATDELHQAFVDGRGALFSDVIIDSVGAIIGIVIVAVLISYHKNRLRINQVLSCVRKCKQ